MSEPDLTPLAIELGVSAETLAALAITRTDDEYRIPERDATGEIIGTQRRLPSGKKIMVTGGHRGLTYTYPLNAYAGTAEDNPVFVVEGMSDTAAGIEIGVDIVGRPSATGGVSHLSALLKDRHVCILAENDDAGRNGAKSVAEGIYPAVASVRIVNPPEGAKDLREWFATPAGPDRDELLALARSVDPMPEPGKPKERRLIVRKSSAIDDDGIKYLWRRRFAAGAINIIFSRPGAGKSTIAADLAARVSKGQHWPDGAPCERGSVLYVKGEGTDASIRDRLKQAGAELSKVAIIGRADAEDDESPMIDLGTDDANLLALPMTEYGDVRLIIIDTLDSLYPSMRMIDNADIRKRLWPMQELAETWGVCVLVLAHTNKGGYADPLDRLSGGRAIGGAARSVWYLGREDREEDVHYLASVKVNDFRPEPTIAYSIVGTGPDTPGSIRWGDTSELSAWDLDNPPKREAGSKAEACTAWMLDRLAAGPVENNTFKREASAAGFGEYVAKKAKTETGATTRAAKGAFPTVYYVCLPDQNPPDLTPEEVACVA